MQAIQIRTENPSHSTLNLSLKSAGGARVKSRKHSIRKPPTKFWGDKSKEADISKLPTRSEKRKPVLSDKVERYLGDRDCRGMMEEVISPENVQHIQNEGMDLITKICENGLAFAEDFASIEACVVALNHVVRNYKLKESLICLLEQGEAFVNSDKFTYLLPPLQYVMMNLPKKREKTFSWVLSILRSHLKYYCKMPDVLKKRFIETEKDETFLFEEEKEVKAIVQTYQDYIDFYAPFVRGLEDKTGNDEENEENIEQERKYLRDYLVDLLGIPLLHFDLEWNGDNAQNLGNRIGPKIKTDGRVLAERIMELLKVVDNSPLDYLQWIEKRMARVQEDMNFTKNEKLSSLGNGDSTSEMDLDSNEEEEEEEIIVHLSSLVTYWYLIFDQELPVHNLTHVYSPTYVVNIILYPVCTVLKNHGDILALKKAIRLFSKIIQLCDTSPYRPGTEISYAHRLHRDLLKRDIHKTFIDRISFVAVYCENESIRKEAYVLFRRYFFTFDSQGKYDIIVYVLNTIPCDSLIGHMISELKQCIYIATEPGHPIFEQDMKAFFLGTSGVRLIQLACQLKNGVTTDLCNFSNQIISSLNMLRFLLILDKKSNKTGIIEIFPSIEEKMLNPLRKALELSRAHYELKLNELNDPHLRKEKENDEVRMFQNMTCDVQIGDKKIQPGDVSLEDQKSSLTHAINTFDQMNALLAWVSEARGTFKS